MLVKAIYRSPKSYALFSHLRWTVDLGLQEERKILKDQSTILKFGFDMMNKFLSADERNFHAWNERMWVVETQLKEFTLRMGEDWDSSPFLQAECDMAMQMINKNFSNFSAWDYRSKLLPWIYGKKEGVYAFPAEIVREDLKKL